MNVYTYGYTYIYIEREGERVPEHRVHIFGLAAKTANCH